MVQEVSFYRHDNYATVKQKFKAIWANLELMIHLSGHKYWKESYDELDNNTIFFKGTEANDFLFTLTGQTLANTALKLFQTHFGGEVEIWRRSEGEIIFSLLPNPSESLSFNNDNQ